MYSVIDLRTSISWGQFSLYVTASGGGCFFAVIYYAAAHEYLLIGHISDPLPCSQLFQRTLQEREVPSRVRTTRDWCQGNYCIPSVQRTVRLTNI